MFNNNNQLLIKKYLKYKRKYLNFGGSLISNSLYAGQICTNSQGFKELIDNINKTQLYENKLKQIIEIFSHESINSDDSAFVGRYTLGNGFVNISKPDKLNPYNKLITFYNDEKHELCKINFTEHYELIKIIKDIKAGHGEINQQITYINPDKEQLKQLINTIDAKVSIQLIDQLWNFFNVFEFELNDSNRSNYIGQYAIKDKYNNNCGFIQISIINPEGKNYDNKLITFYNVKSIKVGEIHFTDFEHLRTIIRYIKAD